MQTVATSSRPWRGREDVQRGQQSTNTFARRASGFWNVGAELGCLIPVSCHRPGMSTISVGPGPTTPQTTRTTTASDDVTAQALGNPSDTRVLTAADEASVIAVIPRRESSPAEVIV